MLKQKTRLSFFLYSPAISLSMYLPGNFNPRLRQNDLSKGDRKTKSYSQYKDWVEKVERRLKRIIV